MKTSNDIEACQILKYRGVKLSKKIIEDKINSIKADSKSSNDDEFDSNFLSPSTRLSGAAAIMEINDRYNAKMNAAVSGPNVAKQIIQSKIIP